MNLIVKLCNLADKNRQIEKKHIKDVEKRRYVPFKLFCEDIGQIYDDHTEYALKNHKTVLCVRPVILVKDNAKRNVYKRRCKRNHHYPIKNLAQLIVRFVTFYFTHFMYLLKIYN